MNIQPLILAYTAAVLVALGVTHYFSSSIEEMLEKLIPEEAAPHWARFVKFAVFVAACGGGMPSVTGGFVDRGAPPPPPALADGLMLVMNSASGALMASAWILLLFFGATLAVQVSGRAFAALRKYREQEAREVAQREEERRLQKARQDRSESHGEPVKRMEAAEPRPVSQEKPAPHPPARR